MKKFSVLSSMFAALFAAAPLVATTAHAVQFGTLDSNYNQQIYAAPLLPGQEAGMAWTTSGNLLTRAGSTIVEYLPATTLVNGTNVHTSTTHNISGLSSSGYGMTKGFDGFIYAATGAGLERFDPNNWATPATLVSSPGGFLNGWGVTTMSDGRIAYADGNVPGQVYAYNPSTTFTTPLYTVPAGVQLDDIEASPSGYIALSGHLTNNILVINNAGTLVNTFSTSTGSGPHAPDGLAFGDGVNANAIFSNNNDGTITKYSLSAGYTGLPTSTDIASNLPTNYAYGDLAAVGPDCAFYVTQYHHNGSPIGTNWDNGSSTFDASIVRISLINSQGLEICGFDSTGHPAPEPSTFVLGGLGVLGLITAARRRRKSRDTGVAIGAPITG